METNYNSLSQQPLQNTCLKIMDKPIILSRVFGKSPPKRCCCCEAHIGLIGFTIISLILFTINTFLELFSLSSPKKPNCIYFDGTRYCIIELPRTVDIILKIISTLANLIIIALTLYGYFRKNVKMLRLGYYIQFTSTYIGVLLMILITISIIFLAPIALSIITILIMFALVLLLEYYLLLVLSTIEHVGEIQQVQQVHPLINDTENQRKTKL